MIRKIRTHKIPKKLLEKKAGVRPTFSTEKVMFAHVPRITMSKKLNAEST
jgi:hypothetical protein